MIEIGADALDRGRIDGRGVEQHPDALHPDVRDQPHIVALQQSEDAVEEADGVEALPCVSPRCVLAEVGPLDLGQDTVQEPGRRIGQVGEIPAFESQEVAGEAVEIRALARPLHGQQRVAADHETLTGIRVAAKLDEIPLVEQRHLAAPNSTLGWPSHSRIPRPAGRGDCATDR